MTTLTQEEIVTEIDGLESLSADYASSINSRTF